LFKPVDPPFSGTMDRMKISQRDFIGEEFSSYFGIIRFSLLLLAPVKMHCVWWLPLLLALILTLINTASSVEASSLSPNVPDLYHRRHAVMARQRKRAATTPKVVAGVGPGHSQVTPKAASAPGVTNSLGRDEDPSPIMYYTSQGQQAYFIPTVDFGSHVSAMTRIELADVLPLASDTLPQ
jgi:hypothetical protein